MLTPTSKVGVGYDDALWQTAGLRWPAGAGSRLLREIAPSCAAFVGVGLVQVRIE